MKCPLIVFSLREEIKGEIMSLNFFERRQKNVEIEWLNKRIAELTPLMARKTSVIRQINDLKRQIAEREVSLAFDDHAGRK